MPLSELYRKLDSTQDKKIAFSSDVPFVPENEFVELVWENGQILMQGAQAGRARKDSILPTHSPKIRDSVGKGSNTKYGKFGMMDCAVNEFQTHRAVGETGLSQDDDLVPWLSYHVDRSDFVSTISGVTGNEGSKRSNTVSVQNGVNSEMRSIRDPSHRPKVSQDSPTGLSRADDLSMTRPKRPGLVAPSRGSVLMNFSHFSRPAALSKASVQNKGVENVSNVAESKLPDSSNGLQKETSPDLRPSRDMPLQEPVAVKQSEFPRQENAPKDDKGSNQVAESPIKAVEPVIACSSVCSGNSVERPSDDATHNSKRKSRDTEDSEWPSEDVEEESMDGKIAAHARAGTSSKRSRAAEVHNLSERRRRDRINEKMRALQELIPNCNKVDKASMLDEAIEYLKTLQFQVQLMAMGAGLYMPPMMMPPGMPNFGHFSPMVGMGMGMGMGMHYGMGVPDMMQGLPMNGTHFPCPLPMPPMSVPSAMHGNAGSNYHSLGPHSQVLPVPMPLAPSIPSMKPCPTQNSDLPLVSGSKDLPRNANSQAMQNMANSSMNQMPTQCQASNKDLHSEAVNNAG